MRSLIKIFFLVAFPLLGFTQTQTTVFTPKGSAVSDTYVVPEFSSSQIAAGNNFVATSYPNATRLTDASATYNCHGYAWHISEGGNNVWIGYYTAAAEDIYWSDGSYVEVCNQTFPAKVSYASDNHSAITTNQTDIFKSKWGQLPVMQHNKDYTPYNSSVLKYYGKISGSNLVCGSEQFSIGAISGISWSSSNTAGLSINSTTGFATRQNSFNGQVTITATIAQACGNVTITQNVWVGVPNQIADILKGSGAIAIGATVPFSIHDPNNMSTGSVTYDWDVSGGYFAWIDTYAWTTITEPYLVLYAGSRNVCGSLGMISRSWSAENGGCPPGEICEMSVFPNPSSDELTVSLSSTDNKNTTTNVKLADSNGTVVYSGTAAKNAKEIKIPVKDLKNGAYYLSITQGRTIKQQQIIIRH